MQEKILAEAIEKMKTLKCNSDCEVTHQQANKILCDVIETICGSDGRELVKAF